MPFPLGLLGTIAGITLGDSVVNAVFGPDAPSQENIDWEGARMILESEIAELERARRSAAVGANAANIATASWAEVRQQIGELRNRLKKNVYSFDVFEVDSFNFGLRVTHRQTWVPGGLPSRSSGRLDAARPGRDPRGERVPEHHRVGRVAQRVEVQLHGVV